MDIKEQFEKDTKNHAVEILLDDGLYRHLRCTNNGSQVYRFDIHTWPGYLCVSGDMGTYVFTRIPDMFEFFNEDRINPGYWGEKLVASDSNGTHASGVKEFSVEQFRENVTNEYNMFCEQFKDEIEEERELMRDDEFRDETDSVEDVILTREHSNVDEDELTATEKKLEDLWESIEEDVLYYAHDGETRAYDAAINFRWESDDGRMEFYMQDFWEYDCKEFTYHYIWILHAITWAIREYNNSTIMEEA